MAFEDQTFGHSGPWNLTHIDWENADHVRSVVACLVQGVYVLEQDRQGRREGSHALARPWWETFGFRLERILKDEADKAKADKAIFGAIFEYKPPPSSSNHSADGPHFVVAFRGTLIKEKSFSKDIELDVKLIRNELHSTSRCKTAMQAVEKLVATADKSKVVWLAGHSLGSAIALLVGKNMAEKKFYLKSFLFNPPYASVPIEEIRNKILTRVIHLIKSGLCAAAALAKLSQEQRNQSANSFEALSPWVPQLFVNKFDYICSGYIGYFKHGKWMQKHKLSAIHKIASRYSVTLLFMRKNGMQAEALYLIPSANLTINSNPTKCFLKAHGIREWWRQDLKLESALYKYKKT